MRLQVGIQKCKIEPYRKKSIIQCYRCQRYGHIASETERCGRCSGDHKMRYCSSNVLKCSNCRGNHVSSDNRCPKFQEVKQKIEGYRNSRITHTRTLCQIQNRNSATETTSARKRKTNSGKESTIYN